MNAINLYDSMIPAIKVASDIFGRPDPFDMLDRVFETEPFLRSSVRSPAVDVREEENRYLIEVELPGLSEKDLKLELKDGVLSLSVAKQEAKEERKAEKWLRRERREFGFSRSFLMPEDSDGDRIEARFKNGLLEIELPKRPQEPAREVPVKIG